MHKSNASGPNGNARLREPNAKGLKTNASGTSSIAEISNIRLFRQIRYKLNHRLRNRSLSIRATICIVHVPRMGWVKRR